VSCGDKLDIAVSRCGLPHDWIKSSAAEFTL
jgi:hypothetical protein